MSLQQLFTSRKPYNAASYIAHRGILFYDETTGYLRLGDGATPGGKLVGWIAATSTSPPANPYEGELWYNPTSKELWAYHNGSFRGTINPATTTTLGGIIVGPGVNVASDGTLSINASGLPLNIGDFLFNGNDMSTVNANEDINIVSNGTGAVNVIGKFSVYKSDGTIQGAMSVPPIFSINSDGQTSILAPLADSLTGAVEIIGSVDGLYQTPINTGVMLHVTGNNSVGNTATVSRIYNDSQGTYALYAGRRYNGTVTNPQPVLAGQDIARFAGSGYTTNGWTSIGSARMTIKALENLTGSAQGGSIEFSVIPLGSTASSIVTATTITATGTTSLRFFGPLTGNADTATKLYSPVTINSVNFDGSANINISNTQTLTISTGLNGSSYNGSSAVIISLNTATLMTNAVNATTSTFAAVAYSLANTTTTYVGHAALADTATNAQTVTGASQPNITSVGTLTGLTVGGNFATTGTIRYNVAYNNATVTQLTSKSTSVVCNGRTGQIITSNSSLNKGVAVQFTVFNNYITSNTDIVVLNIAAGASVGYDISVNNVSSTGTFLVNLHNSDGTGSGSNASDTLTINFAVIKVS